MSKNLLDHLEAKIDLLIQRNRTLEEALARAQAREADLRAERASLLQIQETTRQKIEAMIIRLKAMEQR